MMPNHVYLDSKLDKIMSESCSHTHDQQWCIMKHGVIFAQITSVTKHCCFRGAYPPSLRDPGNSANPVYQGRRWHVHQFPAFSTLLWGQCHLINICCQQHFHHHHLPCNHCRGLLLWNTINNTEFPWVTVMLRFIMMGANKFCSSLDMCFKGIHEMDHTQCSIFRWHGC